jgi:L-ascorbate oxidase
VVALAVAVLSVGCGDDEGTGGTGGSGGAPACVELADGRCVEETFQNPPLLEPNADGVYELTLQPTEITLDGQRHCGRAYNGLYPAPTIDTRTSAEPRQVRVDLRNAFTKSDYRALSQGACTCVDSETGESCTPSAHGHGGSCQCTTEDGNTCHMFDFNVTNLHAHGSHVRPDYAAGGGCVEATGCAAGRARATRREPRRVLLRRRRHQRASSRARACSTAGTSTRTADAPRGPVLVPPAHPRQHRDPGGVGRDGRVDRARALDEMPGIKEARERVMFITTPPTGYPAARRRAEPCDEDHITFNDFTRAGRDRREADQPHQRHAAPAHGHAAGQIERWRLLHGSFLDEITLAVFRGLDADCKDLDLTAPPLALTQIGATA